MPDRVVPAIRRLSDRAALALFIAAESSPRMRAVQRRMYRGIIRALLMERRMGGTRLFEEVRAAMERLGRQRARPMVEALNIDTSDVADMGRIQDFEDRSFGIEGVWVERGKQRAVKHETRCPYSDLLVDMPDFCEKVVHGFEVSTFRELNPRYRLRVLNDGPLLSRRHSHCRFEHDLDGEVA